MKDFQPLLGVIETTWEHGICLSSYTGSGGGMSAYGFVIVLFPRCLTHSYQKSKRGEYAALGSIGPDWTYVLIVYTDG